MMLNWKKSVAYKKACITRERFVFINLGENVAGRVVPDLIFVKKLSV